MYVNVFGSSRHGFGTNQHQKSALISLASDSKNGRESPCQFDSQAMRMPYPRTTCSQIQFVRNPGFCYPTQHLSSVTSLGRIQFATNNG